MIGTLFYTSFVPAPDVLHSAGHLRYTIVDSLKSNLFFLTFFNLKKIYLFIWLCWVFVAARGLSLVAESGGYSSCGARASHGL